MSAFEAMTERAARTTPHGLGRTVRGLSDRAIAWLFIAPTMILLLAINIFPLFWTIYLSFTNYASNRPNRPVVNVGLKWYRDILCSPDIWANMQATAQFVFWTILFQTLIGFALAYLIDPQVPAMASDDHHSHPIDAVAGGGGFHGSSCIAAADRAVQLRRLVLHRHRALVLRDAGFGDAGALGHRHRRYLDVDALRDADLPCGASLHPRLHL
jgi:hypothetical protein